MLGVRIDCTSPRADVRPILLRPGEGRGDGVEVDGASWMGKFVAEVSSLDR